ncbi:hypothetical protein SKAU_G00186310 [Synaphobranchus kaupii]|uniref:Endothelin-like toxin domain-containing protein n=1 Tax=Synaphobranchus kaupii TaxID=118154 RepID=A0A9Q1IUR7_SYNKA|nr:hypothetical protein SKAU_G00186310 [Synaphobranchus kaupii]
MHLHLVLTHDHSNKKKGYSLSITSSDSVSEKASQAQPGSRAARREKRCSCENLHDKECVYFCHIGIVWVNTPRQVVPYGVGSLPVRLKRDVGRCVCANSSDTRCLQFCKASHLLKEQVGITPFKRMFPSKSRGKYEWNLRNSVSVRKDLGGKKKLKYLKAESFEGQTPFVMQ